MRRHPSYDEKLAKELRNREFAADYFISLMEGEEGLDFLDAMKHTIQRMGVKEFSKEAKIHEKSVSRMLASNALPRLETLEQYLSPLGLKLKLIPEKRAA